MHMYAYMYADMYLFLFECVYIILMVSYTCVDCNAKT